MGHSRAEAALHTKKAGSVGVGCSVILLLQGLQICRYLLFVGQAACGGGAHYSACCARRAGGATQGRWMRMSWRRGARFNGELSMHLVFAVSWLSL